MGHRRTVLYSDSSDDETPQDRVKEVAPARRKSSSSYGCRFKLSWLHLAPRGAKERASEGAQDAQYLLSTRSDPSGQRAAWQPLVPISRAQSQHAQSDQSDKQAGERVSTLCGPKLHAHRLADDPGKLRPKSKPKSKEEIEAGRDNHTAPDINFNASDDERARRAAARKNSQEQTVSTDTTTLLCAHHSPLQPTPALQSQSSKRAAHKEPRNEESESSSSSDSDNDKSSGEEDNGENTEHSDLEELEKDPRVLEAQFEAEVCVHHSPNLWSLLMLRPSAIFRLQTGPMMMTNIRTTCRTVVNQQTRAVTSITLTQTQRRPRTRNAPSMFKRASQTPATTTSA